MASTGARNQEFQIQEVKFPVQNSEIAEIFYQVADLLEIEGANQFRVRAFRDAARTVATLSESASEMIAKDADLEELPDIGADLAGKIEEEANLWPKLKPSRILILSQ